MRGYGRLPSFDDRGPLGDRIVRLLAVYTVPASESVSLDYASGDRIEDDRLRAYLNALYDWTGWVGFNLSAIPDDEVIVGIELYAKHTGPYSSPATVRVHFSSSNFWTRTSATTAGVPRTQFVLGSYSSFPAEAWRSFVIDVSARDWSLDLYDNWITLGVTDTNTQDNWALFYGADTSNRPYLEITTTCWR